MLGFTQAMIKAVKDDLNKFDFDEVWANHASIKKALKERDLEKALAKAKAEVCLYG